MRNTGRITTMSKILRFAPLTLLVLYVIVKIAPHIKSQKTNEYEPSASQKQQLSAVIDALDGHPGAAEQFRSLYYGLALVVATDEIVLRTTGDVRMAHENAGAIAIQAGEIPRIPGYAKAVNDFLEEDIGRDNVPLDSRNRKQITEAFKALAWATSQ